MKTPDEIKKAYKVWLENGEGATVVFAKSRNEAKMIALGCDCCEGAQYIDVSAKRMKALDSLYKGESEIDWYDPEMRLILVRDYGLLVMVESGEKVNSKRVAEGLKELFDNTPRWISVEERLPEVDKRYGEYEYSADLNVYDGLRRRVAYYCHTTEMWYDSRYEDDIIEVTHWMPLLEPPKDEMEE